MQPRAEPRDNEDLKDITPAKNVRIAPSNEEEATITDDRNQRSSSVDLETA